ncbi:hypothetical protein CP97_03475 [Aurantiacibacter atlanticus]|uniref:DoxX family protein n=1 Tax=Aurantiacibacter atlanticus TaxID=1648404 RepID=A0A0H4VEQ0_9SPHN|nr:hypothetical protein CP97_03475 [Aurantiacibacter atlanticus]
MLVLLALLSLAAGFAKLTHAPDEIAFYSGLGINLNWLLPFGILQAGGALICMIPRIRKAGLLMIAAGFALSSLFIFASGYPVFGIVSLLPLAVSIWLMDRTPRPLRA